MKRPILVLFIGLLIVLMTIMVQPTVSLAQWTKDGIPIRVDTLRSWVYHPEITTDGEKGAIITWPDPRKGEGGFDIYAQRVDSSGVVRWQINGIPICEAPGSDGSSGNQYCVKIVSDGQGGAIMAWEDFRTPSRDIWAQRVDGDGNTYWPKDGVPICTRGGQQEYLELVSDGAHGAIIAFEDSRTWQTTGEDIYAQRVDSAGHILWDSSGVVICNAPDDQWVPKLTMDGEGGAIIVWHEGEAHGGGDVYAQRVDGNGNVLWEENGRPICLDEGTQGRPRIISDGNQGAIITWLSGGGERLGICAQRINGDGEVLWVEGGLLVFLESVDSQHGLVSDGNGGVIVASGWGAPQPYIGPIHVQRISQDGSFKWGEGVAVSNFGGTISRAITDDKGGIIVTWEVSREAPYFYNNIYAQRVDSGGVVAWEPDSAVLVCGAPFNQEIARAVGDGTGGTIVTWVDWRNSSYYEDTIYVRDIYAQRIYSDGRPEVEPGLWDNRPPLQFELLQNYPNPFNPKTIINYRLSFARPIHTTLKIYNLLGEEVITLVDEPQRAGKYQVVWSGHDSRGVEVSSGIYFCVLKMGSNYKKTNKMILLR